MAQQGEKSPVQHAVFTGGDVRSGLWQKLLTDDMSRSNLQTTEQKAVWGARPPSHQMQTQQAQAHTQQAQQAPSAQYFEAVDRIAEGDTTKCVWANFFNGDIDLTDATRAFRKYGNVAKVFPIDFAGRKGVVYLAQYTNQKDALNAIKNMRTCPVTGGPIDVRLAYHDTPCVFLRKTGFCKAGSACAFSHDSRIIGKDKAKDRDRGSAGSEYSHPEGVKTKKVTRWLNKKMSPLMLGRSLESPSHTEYAPDHTPTHQHDHVPTYPPDYALVHAQLPATTCPQVSASTQSSVPTQAFAAVQTPAASHTEETSSEGMSAEEVPLKTSPTSSPSFVPQGKAGIEQAIAKKCKKILDEIFTEEFDHILTKEIREMFDAAFALLKKRAFVEGEKNDIHEKILAFNLRKKMDPQSVKPAEHELFEKRLHMRQDRENLLAYIKEQFSETVESIENMAHGVGKKAFLMRKIDDLELERLHVQLYNFLAMERAK